MLQKRSVVTGLAFLLSICFYPTAASFAQNVFYKIPIEQEGIFKLDKAWLSHFEINLEGVDPRTIRIFNNGGHELPQDINASRPVDLIENAIYVSGEADGRFDPDDFILFYARGMHGHDFDSRTKTYRYHLHHFTNQNVYWLTFGGVAFGKRMQLVDGAPIRTAAMRPASFRDRIHLEEEQFNPNRAGLTWYWQFISSGESPNFKFASNAPVVADSVTVTIQLMGASQGDFEIFLNKFFLGRFTSNRFRPETFRASAAGVLRSGENSFEMQSANLFAYWDWLEIEYNSYFVAAANRLIFSAPPSDRLFEYTISGFTDSTFAAFEISQFDQVAKIINAKISKQGTFQITFQDSSRANLPKKYILSTPAHWLQPDSIFLAAPSNLRQSPRNADFVIITHEDFYSEAVRLANYRQARDGLVATVVLISDIFDEFAAGVYDPVAIRDFLKFAFDHWALRPAYVLLFGDGDYDYKNILQQTDKNWIPPFEIDGDDAEVRASDDWYTYLTGNDLLMDLSIGRLPVHTADEARIVVDKIIQYENSGTFGPWRNRAVISADDILANGQPSQVEIIFTKSAEKLAETFFSPRFDLEKIYAIEYPAQNDSSGRVYKPAARAEMIRQINRGAFMVNYTGHSNMLQLAHENIFDLAAVDELTNKNMLPFIFAASSQFPKFDDPIYVSIPEKMMVKPEGGAIAIVGSIGLVNYASIVSDLNQAFHTQFFQNPKQRLGDVLRLAKSASLITSADPQIQKFHLIGDPTMRLAFPVQQAEVTTLRPDTLKGQSLVQLAGSILQNGQIQSGFNGEAEIRVYGPKKLTSYMFEGKSLTQFLQPGKLLVRGIQLVNQGRFLSQFFIPADAVNEAGPTGKISLYSWNDQIDGSGFAYPIPVGGIDRARADTTPPVISLSIIEGTVGSDTVSQNFVLQVMLADSSGINLFTSLGKGILLSFDGQTEIDVSESFAYDRGSFTRGSLVYRVTSLSEGRRMIGVKAWDNFNNLATQQFEIFVTEVKARGTTSLPRQFALHQNFPNPFNPSTAVQIDLPRKTYVSVQIYNILGQRVRTLMDEDKLAGSYTLRWDGQNGGGHEMPSGIYLVRMTAENFAKTIKIVKVK